MTLINRQLSLGISDNKKTGFMELRSGLLPFVVVASAVNDWFGVRFSGDYVEIDYCRLDRENLLFIFGTMNDNCMGIFVHGFAFLGIALFSCQSISLACI